MRHTTVLERALASAIAAVLSAGVLAAVLGAADPAPGELEAGRAEVATVGSDLTDARAASAAGAVALDPGPPAPPTTVAPVVTAPPTTGPGPAAGPPAPATTPSVPPATAPPAPPPTSPPTTAAPRPRPPATTFDRDPSCEANMLRWMNEARSSRGLRALSHDPEIQWIPVEWSDTMATRRQLAHNPDFGDQVFAERPEATSASENVGRSTGSDRSIFDGFMDSPTHRAEILSSTSTHAAVGCLRDGSGELWVTVNFWG